MDWTHYVSADNRAMKLYRKGIAQDAARGLSNCQGALNSIAEALQYEPDEGDAQTLRRQITGCISSCNGQIAVLRGDIDLGISYFRQAESEYPESNSLWSRALLGPSRSGSRRLPRSSRRLPMRKRRPMRTGPRQSRRRSMPSGSRASGFMQTMTTRARRRSGGKSSLLTLKTPQPTSTWDFRFSVKKVTPRPRRRFAR